MDGCQYTLQRNRLTFVKFERELFVSAFNR